MVSAHHPTLLSCDLCAGELLDTPPPGIDEAIAIAMVLQFLKVRAGAGVPWWVLARPGGQVPVCRRLIW